MVIEKATMHTALKLHMTSPRGQRPATMAAKEGIQRNTPVQRSDDVIEVMNTLVTGFILRTRWITNRAKVLPVRLAKIVMARISDLSVVAINGLPLVVVVLVVVSLLVPIVKLETSIAAQVVFT